MFPNNIKNNIDYNDLPIGIHYCGTGCTNSPGDYYRVICLYNASNDHDKIQVAYSVVSGIMSIRTSVNTTWKEWKKFSDDTSVLDQAANMCIPMKIIIYTSQNKQESINYVNNPTLLFGKKNTAYCIYFQDKVGDSPFNGGDSMVLGYTYSNNNYGAQFYIKYNGVFQKRYKNNGEWTEFVNI